MGFNFKMIGYSSVSEMVDKFSTSLEEQFNGFFTFIERNSRCLKALTTKADKVEAIKQKYIAFAAAYNGPGKKEDYGAKIYDFAAAFNAIKSESESSKKEATVLNPDGDKCNDGGFE